MPRLILVSAPTGAQPRVLEELLGSLKKDGYELDRRFETSDWHSLFEEAMVPGLFTSKRVFTIADGPSLGALPERFLAEIEGPEADVVLIVCYEKDPAKEIGKPAVAKVEIFREKPAPTWPSERRSWLIGLAREKGLQINSEAAALMVEWIEDEEELRSELQKLASACNGRPISADMVRKLSMDDGGKSMLNLLDGIARGDTPMIVKSLAQMRDSSVLIPTISAIHKRVRGAYYVGRWGSTGAKAIGLSPYQTKLGGQLARRCGLQVLAYWMGELIRLSWSERTGEGEDWNGLERTILGALSCTSPKFGRSE